MKEIVLEYIDKYFPTLSKRKIGKILFHDHPDIFKDAEGARKKVRYYLGENGEKSRSHKPNEYLLPVEENEDYSPFVIPEACDKILVMADVHAPYHDNGAIMVATKYGKRVGVNTILLNGDIFDFYSFSRFRKDPRLVNPKVDITSGIEFLTWLRGEFTECEIYFRYANHDDRIEKYAIANAPLLWQADLIRLDDVLGLTKLGITTIRDNHIVHAGKLRLIHGHEIHGSGDLAFPARTVYNACHKSMFVDHSHRTSLHTEPDVDKKVVTCWSGGCLCTLFPAWKPINKWNHGFAVVSTEGDLFDVENMRIIDGRACH